MSMLRIILVLVLLVTGCSSPEAAVKETVQSSEDSFKLTRVKDLSEISPDEVFTFLCEFVYQKPSQSTPNCADFGEAVFDITWISWSAEGAKGKGTYSINDCEPDCASGTRHEAPVDVALENLFTDGKRYFLRDFTYRAEKSALPGYPESGGWDTADFYINVPDMRSDG
jgi:hypothetical protein